MWTPIIDFGNFIEYELTKVYGAGGHADSTNMWYLEKEELFQYSEGSKLTFSCDFNLNSFPFDSHECSMYIRSTENSSIVLMKPSKIVFGEKTTTMNENPITMNRVYQSYQLTLESLPTVDFMVDCNNYSSTGIKFLLTRKSLGHLASTYFYPTGSFAFLSMISFLVKPEIVSISSIFKIIFLNKVPFVNYS